jgi:hypothetical protein
MFPLPPPTPSGKEGHKDDMPLYMSDVQRPLLGNGGCFMSHATQPMKQQGGKRKQDTGGDDVPPFPPDERQEVIRSIAFDTPFRNTEGTLEIDASLEVAPEVPNMQAMASTATRARGMGAIRSPCPPSPDRVL